MQTNIDLTAAWNSYIAKGLMKNVFASSAGKIEAGMRPSPNGPEQYVIDLATGQNICEPPQLKHFANGMEILFDPFGGLKPYIPPTKSGKQDELPSAAAACVFACQDPANPLSLLKRTPLLQTKFTNHEWLAFPNVTPWEPRGLLLWVPTTPNETSITLPHQSQILTHAAVEDFLEISLANENFITFFNSLNGAASANHLHFQSCYLNRKMAVELAKQTQKVKYTFTDGYCAPALVWPKNIDADTLWEVIAKIQQTGKPLNLIALSSGIYLFVRNRDNEIVDEFPGRGLGAINLAGMMITGDKSYFTRVNENTIASAFAKTTLNPTNLDFLLKE